MSVIAGIFTGALLGVYFAEKEAAFPLRYNRRPQGQAGSLELDLQIVNVIFADIKSAVGYTTEVEPVAAPKEPHI